MHRSFALSITPPRRSIIERRITRRGIQRLSIEPTLLERRLCEAFDVFDNARSGEVDVRDLGTIIRALGCVITEAELQEIQVEVEDVENNCVPLNRFVEYMRKAINERKFKPADPEELFKAFQLLDPENRGYIMRDDLEKAIMEIGEPFTKEEVADMMAVACDAETGKINYEHYINLLIVYKNTYLFSIFLTFIHQKYILFRKKIYHSKSCLSPLKKICIGKNSRRS